MLIGRERNREINVSGGIAESAYLVGGYVLVGEEMCMYIEGIGAYTTDTSSGLPANLAR